MNSSNFFPRLMIGLFLVLLGLGFFFDQLGLNVFGFNLFNLWPIVFIIWGLWCLATRKFTAAMFLFLIGFAFLISNFFNFSVWSVIWPLFIVILGVSILFKPSRHWGGNWAEQGSEAKKDTLNESVVFGSYNEVIKSDNFKGGKLDSVFGGFKLDLSNVKIAKEGANLEVNSVFGGGEVIVSKDVRVDVENSSVMGGVTNRATTSTKVSSSLLRIKASAVFGGVDIKN